MKAINKSLTISLLITLFSLGFLYSYAQPPGWDDTNKGSKSVCAGATGVVYTVDSPIPKGTGYLWYAPNGVTIFSGRNTNCITLDFSASAISGNIGGFLITPPPNQKTCNFISLPITIKNLPVPTGFTGKLIVCPGANNVGYSVSAITGATGAFIKLTF